MKLLLDANLSWRLIKKLQPFFEVVVHSQDVKIAQPAKDIDIWNFAKQNDLVIVSKDDDFEKIALLKGAPPKVIYLKTYNSNTQILSKILINNKIEIERFCNSTTDGILEIYFS